MLDILNKESIFYILCPANVATGGPELLHQLAFEMKKHNKKVFMCYVPPKGNDPVHKNYKEYGIDYVYEVEDKNENVIIFPEIYTEQMYKYFNAKKIIWWLSVDNYFHSRPGFKGRVNRFLLNKLNSQNFYFFDDNVKFADSHLVQSFYAGEFLKSKGIENFDFLSDFLHPAFLQEETNLREKQNIVAYNPKKGVSFTKKLISYAPDIEFVPIQNMTREEVVALLKLAKVYIDFGNHPGKDRIPREAVYLHSCVITGAKGSAKYFQDVPTQSDFKFEDKDSNLSAIRNRIIACFKDFKEYDIKFDSYRKIIKKQQSDFEKAVANIFIHSK